MSAYIKQITKDTVLRAYQQKAKDSIYEAWSVYDHVMLQMPTGTGKTKVLCSILKDIKENSIAETKPFKALVIAHTTELIDQIDNSIKDYHLAHCVYRANNRDTKLPIIISSIQTITHPNAIEDIERIKDKVDFIIIDEAHHSVAETYRQLWTSFSNAKILGLTATPCRLDHKGFTDLFEKLILSRPIKEFIRQGYLSKYNYYSIKPDSFVQQQIDELDKDIDCFGDYNEAALVRTMDTDSIRAQLFKSYIKYAKGKKGIIYSINREHSRNICDKYKRAGISIACIDADTPKLEREALVKDFKHGKIKILVNVNIFSEGFDCPEIEFIQLARPTKSLSIFLQQVGRGLRKPKQAQIEPCIILDNVGLYSKFGLPDTFRHWNAHFAGIHISEQPQSELFAKRKIQGEPDLSEGNEDMELIQGNDFTQEDILTLLENYGYLPTGHILWNEDGEIYDTWISSNEYAIIDKIELSSDNHITRRRVLQCSKENKSIVFWIMCFGCFSELHQIVCSGRKKSMITFALPTDDEESDKKEYATCDCYGNFQNFESTEQNQTLLEVTDDEMEQKLMEETPYYIIEEDVDFITINKREPQGLSFITRVPKNVTFSIAQDLLDNSLCQIITANKFGILLGAIFVDKHYHEFRYDIQTGLYRNDYIDIIDDESPSFHVWHNVKKNFEVIDIREKSLYEKLFPMEGLILGKTTLHECKQMWYELDEESRIFSCGGFWYYDANRDCISTLYLARGFNVPDKLKSIGFDLNFSYNQYMDWIKKHAQNVKVKEKPSVLPNRQFFAVVNAKSKEGDLLISCNFVAETKHNLAKSRDKRKTINEFSIISLQ